MAEPCQGACEMALPGMVLDDEDGCAVEPCQPPRGFEGGCAVEPCKLPRGFSSCSTDWGGELRQSDSMLSVPATLTPSSRPMTPSSHPGSRTNGIDPCLDSFSTCSDLVRWAERGETLILFDWDDTLCPTTSGKDADAATLAEHARIVESLIRVAHTLGRVEIVTMAGLGWVEETIQKYMPNIAHVLKELEIPVRYARAGVPKRELREAFMEGRDPSHYMKRRIMTKAISKFYRAVRGGSPGAARAPRSWKNVLSIGDSDAERLALQDVVLGHAQRDSAGRWQICRCKVVKLKSGPSVEELMSQLVELATALEAFVCHDGDLDMEFEHADQAEQ